MQRDLKPRFARVNDWYIDADCLPDRFARIYRRQCMIKDRSGIAMEFISIRRGF